MTESKFQQERKEAMVWWNVLQWSPELIAKMLKTFDWAMPQTGREIQRVHQMYTAILKNMEFMVVDFPVKLFINEAEHHETPHIHIKFYSTIGLSGIIYVVDVVNTPHGLMDRLVGVNMASAQDFFNNEVKRYKLRSYWDKMEDIY